MPFIFTLNQRELYRIVTYYFLYFGENLSEVNANEIKYLASLGERKALEVILNDYRWTSQSNQIWANSTPHSIDYWKNETWFGSFMDKYFPWTFHSSLGWIYIQGSNPMDFWFIQASKTLGFGQEPIFFLCLFLGEKRLALFRNEHSDAI